MAQMKWNCLSKKKPYFFGAAFSEMQMKKSGIVPKILEDRVLVVGIRLPPQIDYCATFVADTQCYPSFHGSVVRIR